MSVMYLFKNRLPNALLETFPTLNLDPKKIKNKMSRHIQLWRNKQRDKFQVVNEDEFYDDY